MVEITLWYTIGAAGMALGTIMLAYGLRLLPGERRRPFLLVVSVPAIAAVAYALLTLEIGWLTGADGTSVFLPRYVDWMVTTPIHVAFMALLVGASRSLIARVAGLQALTIAFGLAGAYLSAPLSYGAFALGALTFAGVVYYFYRDLDGLAGQQSDHVASLFRKLRSFVVVLWLIYPVIWLLAPAGVGLMDAETTALVVSYIDVVAKVGFGLIALNDYVNLAELDVTTDEEFAAAD
jgi:sensory rhodopsin